MKQNAEKIVGSILESYNKHEKTCRRDEDNMINRELLIEVTEEIRRLLFPGFFEGAKLRGEYVKYLVGQRLEFIQYNLSKQIARIIGDCEKNNEDCRCEARAHAEEIVYEFLDRIPYIRDCLATDVEAAYAGDPAAYSTDEIIFSYPGLFAITVYRIAHELWKLDVPMIPRIMTEHAHSVTGIDIHPGATIGHHFFIDHGTGIVIGETTVIGNNVKIYQGVTLGALSTRKGQQLQGVKRHPTIGDDVTIYSSASILGGDTVIGNGVTVGGNAFIVSSVSDGMKVSVKNPELQFSQGSSGELSQAEFWTWEI
ncbi:MAG: serine acetyltransferase [Oscillospiraceae bacterium]|nr:serine acetyltransferase [Oscillospiraceae bacterium]